MTFKTVLSCPKNIDTIVCYTQHDAVPLIFIWMKMNWIYQPEL